jgi:predicted nucleotidyltransferase
MKNKVVISEEYGGFELSDDAKKRLQELTGESDYIYERTDKYLIQVVEELGKEASSIFSDLVVKEFEGCFYRIREYDGYEYLETPDSIKWDIVPNSKCEKKYPEYFI